MAHQVPHPVPVPDDDDVAHLSTPGLGMTPRTLSFINNVQSAVAQIEHRLATSPSAQPPPPSRQELPETPPGPNDPIIDRVQFLESSLSLAPPISSNPTSHSDSPFAGAINLNSSLVSSGAILSTAPRNSMIPNASTPVNDCHASHIHPQPHLPSTSALETTDDAITTNEAVTTDDVITTDDAVNTPASSIAPIVEQFETAGNPAQAKEPCSEIVAVPIAPIVEQFEVPSVGTPQSHQVAVDDATPTPIAPIVSHFEAASHIPESANNPQNTEPSNEAPIAPVVKESEALVVDDERFTSDASTEPNRTDIDSQPTSFEKNETSSSTTSKQIEPEISAESDVLAAVPAVSRPGQDCASDVTTLEPPSSTHEEAQSASNVTDALTATPGTDHAGHITGKFAKSSLSNGVSAEIETTNSAGILSPRVAEPQSPERSAAEVDESSNGDGTSQPLTTALDEETKASQEGAEVMPQRSQLGGMSEDVSRDPTEPKSDEDIGDTSIEIADVEASEMGPCDEEQEAQLAPDDGNSMPSQMDDATMMKATGCGELETPVCSSATQERLGVGIPSSGSELKNTEEISTTAVGDTGPTQEGEHSNIHMGKSTNIVTTSKDETILAPTRDAVEIDNKTLAETGNALRNCVVSEPEQKTSHEYQDTENSVQSSGSFPEGTGSSRPGSDSSSREETGPDAPVEGQPPSDTARMNPFTPEEDPAEAEPEVNKSVEDTKYEEDVTGVQRSEEVSSVVYIAEEQGNEAAIGAKDGLTSSVHREPYAQNHQDGNQKANEKEAREIMAAKAVFARDKLAKFSLGSPVKKPHRGPFIRKTGDGRDSPVKGSGSIAISPRTRRSPGGCSSKSGSFNRMKLAATFHTPPISAILDKTYESPEQSKPRSPSASSQGTDSILKGLPPRQSSTETGKTPPPRTRSAAGYARSDSRQDVSRSEPQSPLVLSQASSDNKPRLPRVAELTSAKSGSSRTPRSAPNLRAKTRIPRAATFSTTVPRSKANVSSPIVGRKVGISSSPVTPTSVGRSSGAARPQLRRTLSFTQTKPSVEPTSPPSRPASFRVRSGDASSTFSLSTSGSKPPRGGRPRFTVPEPFALTGPELYDRTEKQKEEARRRAAEAEARPRVFKPRPMPDFSKPYPKPK